MKRLPTECIQQIQSLLVNENTIVLYFKDIKANPVSKKKKNKENRKGKVKAKLKTETCTLFAVKFELQKLTKRIKGVEGTQKFHSEIIYTEANGDYEHNEENIFAAIRDLINNQYPSTKLLLVYIGEDKLEIPIGGQNPTEIKDEANLQAPPQEDSPTLAESDDVLDVTKLEDGVYWED